MNYQLSGLDPLDLKLQRELYKEADNIMIDLMNATFLLRMAVIRGDDEDVRELTHNYELAAKSALSHLLENIPATELNSRLAWVNRDKVDDPRVVSNRSDKVAYSCTLDGDERCR